MNEANAAGANVTGRRNEFGSIELTVVTKSPSHSPTPVTPLMSASRLEFCDLLSAERPGEAP